MVINFHKYPLKKAIDLIMLVLLYYPSKVSPQLGKLKTQMFIEKNWYCCKVIKKSKKIWFIKK